jgi:hypothetical protein
MKKLVALAVLGCASFGQAEAADFILPKSIYCQAPSVKDGYGDFMMYARTQNLRSMQDIKDYGAYISSVLPIQKDEVASTWAYNDHTNVSISTEEFRYSTWSCDTTDFDITIKTSELIRWEGKGGRTKSVTAHVLVSTRGITDFEADVACTAVY